ncbi:MAG TPA: hypothetical protein VK750_07655, partial [Cytophagaceae bacterium]|nr:hypothetical protein [Cytophagaceae bacterium]
MKNNKTLIISVIALVLGIVGWVSYRVFHTKEKIDVFNLIPSETSMVIEISDVREFYKKTTGKHVMKGLLGIPSIKEWTKKANAVIPLLDSLGFENALPKGNPVYCSVHASASREMGLVWYIPFDNEDWESKINEHLSSQTKNGTYLFEERKYEGKTLRELVNKQTKEVLTFTWHHNVLIGSYTGYLVEDVIRLIRTEYEGHFMSGLEMQRQASSKIHYDDGNVFVNYAQMPYFLGCFASDSTDQFIKGISTFAETGVYDITLNNGKWLFHGFTYYTPGAGSYCSVFEGQKPQPFTLNDYVPMNTAVCYFWGGDNTKERYRRWLEYNNHLDKKYTEKLKDWEAQHRLAIEHEFLTILGNEMTLLTFPIASPSAPTDKVLLIRTKNAAAAQEKLTDWRTRNKSLQNELYSEFYDGHKIYQWAAEDIGYWLCGDVAKGFSKVYYTFIQDALVIGNTMEAVKNIVKAYNNQDVWRRNVNMVSRWKDLTASNFSLFVQPQQLKGTLQRDLNPFFSSSIKQYEQQYNMLSSIVIQFAYSQDKLYTNMVIENNFSQQVVMEVNSFDPITEPVKIAVGAELHKVAVSDNWTDVFYTDSTHTLHLIDAKGNAAWRYAMGAALQGNISSGDFNKDGSSDYIFIAGKRIHAVSNKGQLLSGFPLVLPDSLNAQYLSVIDYDRTKNYRLAISDMYGHVLLYDMTGKVLEGWSGKDFGAKLCAPVVHMRLGNNDRILGWNAKGDFYSFNRRAELQPNFPVHTGQPALSSYIIEKGTSFANTNVYTISDKGLKSKFTLEGKLVAKSELYRGIANG